LDLLKEDEEEDERERERERETYILQVDFFIAALDCIKTFLLIFAKF